VEKLSLSIKQTNPSTLMQRSLLAFLLLLATYLTAQAQPQTYPVVGRCHDFYTALGLKASIYAVVDGTRQKLGEAKDVGKFEPQTGTFRVDVPVRTTQLILEMPGYRTVTIPVSLADAVPTGESFAICNWGEMTPVDSLPKSTKLQKMHEQFIYGHFILPDSLRSDWIMYRLTNLNGGKDVIVGTSARKNENSVRIPIHAQPGEYMAVLTDKKGRVLSVETVIVKPGITFKTIWAQYPRAVSNNVPVQSQQSVNQPYTSANVEPTGIVNVPSPVITAPSATTLYFDQSSYDLRTQTRHTLDSLTGVLTAQPSLQAIISGYTDNVGQRTPNLTLAEYRARTVATYLTQRGITPERITAQGKGPTTPTDTTEATKRTHRRVEVELRPAVSRE
jgi:outer membrane protein OmpA-like peptidoglycan-associated protein